VILSDRDIRTALKTGNLVIDPKPDIIQPASVDLHLGDDGIVLRSGVIDPYHDYRDDRTNEHKMVTPLHLLAPGDFLNVHTLEWIEIPSKLVGILVGKSSLARIGLQVESAGYVDPGWCGRLTLELKNLGPLDIVLRPGMPICQIRFQTLTSKPEHLYGDPALNSHYQGSEGPVEGRFDPPPTS